MRKYSSEWTAIVAVAKMAESVQITRTRRAANPPEHLQITGSRPAACGARAANPSPCRPTWGRLSLGTPPRSLPPPSTTTPVGPTTSRVRQYLAWLDRSPVDGDPLTDPAARDGAARDYRTYLQTVAGRKPATINTVLAALGDFYTRAGLGPPDVRRLDLPQPAPRALTSRDATRWLRTVERWPNPRDRVLALLPYYAGAAPRRDRRAQYQ